MALSMFAGVLLVAMSFCAVACDSEEDDDGSEGIDPPSEDHNENSEVSEKVLEAVEDFKTFSENLERQQRFYDDLTDDQHAVTDEGIKVQFHHLRLKRLSHFKKRITSTTLELTYKNLDITGEYIMTKTEKKTTGMFNMTPKKVVVTYEITFNPETGEIKLIFKGLSITQAHTDFMEHFKHIIKVVVNNWHIHLSEHSFIKKIKPVIENILSEYFEKGILTKLQGLL